MFARQSLTLDAEPLVLESDPGMEVEETETEDRNGPLEPLIYIPLRKGRRELSIAKRLQMLRMDLEEVEMEPVNLPISVAFCREDPVAEVHELVHRAGTYMKATETQTPDLSLKGAVPRLLAASMAISLHSDQSPSYSLRTGYPEQVREEMLDTAALASRLVSRLCKVEGVVGTWSPKLGFGSVTQSLNLCRKTLSRLDSKYLKVLNSQAETIKADLEMIAYQRDNLLGANLDQSQLDQLADLLSELRAIAPALEPLVRRLTELRKAQERAAGFKLRLTKIAEQLSKAEQKLREANLAEVVEKWGKCKLHLQEALSSITT